MKKTLIAVAAAAALFTVSATAEVVFGTWLRALWSPVAGDKDDVLTSMDNSWGWGARTARFDCNWVSEDEKAGMTVQIFFDGIDCSIAQGDQANFWVRPIDPIRLSVGNFDHNVLRGDMCYGSWNWIRPQNWLVDDEGLTFNGEGNQGFMLEIMPIDLLYIYALVPEKGGFQQTAEWTYRNANAALSVNILDVAKIKVGWFGNWNGKKEDRTSTYKADGIDWFQDENGEWSIRPENYKNMGDADKIAGETQGTLGVAVDLSIIDPLYITVGFRYNVADNDAYKDGLDMFDITAGVSWQVIDALKLSLSGGVFIYDQDDSNLSNVRFQVGIGADFAVMDGLSLVADCRLLSPMNMDEWGGKDDYDPMSISFMVGATYSVGSNGLVGVAFQGVTGNNGFLPNGNASMKTDKDTFAWAVPIQLSIWF